MEVNILHQICDYTTVTSFQHWISHLSQPWFRAQGPNTTNISYCVHVQNYPNSNQSLPECYPSCNAPIEFFSQDESKEVRLLMVLAGLPSSEYAFDSFESKIFARVQFFLPKMGNYKIRIDPLQTIAIIGGGIGGLNLAQAIKVYKSSLQVTVYERSESPSSRPQGFHIGINTWGLESLKEAKIGGIDEIFARNTVTGFTVLDEHLSEMLRIGGPVKPGEKPSKLATGIIDRTDLRNGLVEGVNIVYHKKFIKYEETDDKIKIFFEDGSTVDADFMVGADGCWSKVRAQFTPSIKYEPTGIISFGALMKGFSPEEMPTLNKFLKYSMIRTSSPSGYSVLIGLCHPPSGKPDLFFGISFPENIITEPLPEGKAESLQFVKEIVRKDFHPEVLLIAERVEESNVIFDGFYKTRTTNYQAENPLSKVAHKRLTLLGDAAHAMTTNKGMGANTSLKDSIDLAKALTTDDADWPAAIAKYEDIMWKRGSKEVKESLIMSWRNHQIGWKFTFGKYMMKGVNGILWLTGMNSK